MIPRYSRPEMSAIFSDEARFTMWLSVELAAIEAMAEVGMVPQAAADECKKKGSFNVERIHEVEKEVKHDVIAFLTSVNESIGASSRFLHFGMTSSDLIDTAYALQLKAAGKILMQGIDELRAAIRQRAEEYRTLPAIGRSHGIHAEPTSFGLKLLNWYAELSRGKIRLIAALDEVNTGSISGAVGTHSAVSLEVESRILNKLGLRAEPVATQVIPRDRHAVFFSTLAIIAAGIERWAVEIRHLQRTEVREVEEAFSAGQKGSSAMPHKKNPILSENLTGLSRLMRSYAQAAMENIPLWHERDISHSSVERVITPDACITLDFMLARMKGLVTGLRVIEENVSGNLNRTRKLYASGSLLVALTEAGLSREDAYKKVQSHALPAWEEAPDLEERAKRDPEITAKLSLEKLDEIFSLSKHLKEIDGIFARVFAVYP